MTPILLLVMAAFVIVATLWHGMRGFLCSITPCLATIAAVIHRSISDGVNWPALIALVAIAVLPAAIGTTR